MLVMVIYSDNIIMMLNLIKVKFLRGGGEMREFGEEASSLGPPPLLPSARPANRIRFPDLLTQRVEMRSN